MPTALPEQINADTFLAITKIALSSVERLAMLNLNATRSALENSFSKSVPTLDAKGGKDLHNEIAAMPTTVGNNAVAYMQGVQEIAADTQREMAKLMNAYFSEGALGTKSSEGWNKGFEMFKNFGQQMSSLTDANTRIASETGNRIASSVSAAAKKQL